MTLAYWVLLLPLSGSAASVAQTRIPIVESLDLAVLQAPVIANVGGKQRLVYELHLTNLRSVDVALTRVEVLDGAKVIGNFRDAELQKALEQPSANRDIPDKRVVGSGMRAVLYVWLPLETGREPASLTHRIEFDVIRSATDRQRIVMQGSHTSVRKDAAPLVLGPPLQEGPWVGIYDPFGERGHRRVLYTIDGRTRIPARFAIDYLKLGKDHQFAHGDKTKIANWTGYGANVIAVADATVVDAKDDIAESPSIVDPPERIALENGSGNFISLDLGGGRYAFYEHLKPNSIRVKVGDRVRRGDVIAALGNTGSSSSGPHLHFHVSDANSSLVAESVPYVLDQYEWIGTFETMEAVGSGSAPSPIEKGVNVKRQGELPAPNVVVKF